MSVVVAAAGHTATSRSVTWVLQATESARYAGPDGDAVHVGDRFAMGTALLRTATYDVAEPVSLDGATWVSADARLDDRAGLVRDLRAAGAAVPAAPSDPELILHAHRAWRETFVDHLAGEFAFALWDAATSSLLAVRDQLGTTPLYTARAGRGLLVSSSVDALLLHRDVSDRLDDRWIADFLVRGTQADFESTVYCDIRQVAPAHVVRWHGGHVSAARYWTVPDRVPLVRFPRAEDYAEHLRDVLDAAVADRITDDRVSVQLSGGMDSGSIAVTAAAVMAERGAPAGAVRAVTAVLGGDSGDREGEYASLVASLAGLPHDVIDGAGLPEPDPLAPPAVTTPWPTDYQRSTLGAELLRAAERHAPIGLSGVAGDALVWGSPWYWAGWLARGDVMRLWQANADHRRLFGDRLHPHLRRGLARLARPPWWGLAPIPLWVDADLAARTDVARRALPRRQHARTWDARGMATTTFWPSMCTVSHATVTGSQVAYRFPLLDLRLVRLVRGLPPEPWLRDKRVLREAMIERLPEEVRQRPKELLVAPPTRADARPELARMVELLRGAPDLATYVDVDALVADIAAAGADPLLELRLGRPLGLAQWLTHRRAPKSSSVQVSRPPRYV